MKSTATYLLCAGLLLPLLSTAQKVTDREISYEYQRKPLMPLDKSLKNYHSQVVLAFEEEEKAKQTRYEQALANVDQNYQAALAEHEKAKQAAQADYDKLLADYNKKSLGSKLLDKQLLDQGKPVLRMPYPPQKEAPVPPLMRKKLDKDMLASSYVKLAGYNRQNQNAVVVTVTLFGFEASEAKPDNSGTAFMAGQTGANVNYVVTYRHPMSVKVEVPGQGVVYNEALPELSEYKEYRSTNPLNTPESRKLALDPIEDKLLDQNLKIVGEFLNSRYGYSPVTRKTLLYTVEPKKMTYDEYQPAFEAALMGYKKLGDNPTLAKQQLQTATTQWDKALAESKPADSKARINEEITIVTLFDAAEASIWMGEFDKADNQLLKLSTMDLSRKQKKAEQELEALAKDERKRADANR